jgi:Fe2+ transport system protein FeoA
VAQAEEVFMKCIAADCETNAWGHADESMPASMGIDPEAQQPPVPMRLAHEGEWVRIVALCGGRGFQDRLAGMGLHIGGRLEIIRNRFDGKLLLGHDGTRLFLGGGMAQRILVVIEGRRS